MTLETFPTRQHWREALASLRSDQSSNRILGGSMVMLVGSGLVSAVNFGYNVAVARLLGPAAFGHAAAAVTLLMLLSAITLAFQLVCAKFIAKNESAGAKAMVFTVLRRRAWCVGVILGSCLILLSGRVASYLNLPSPQLVVVLALGVAFYIPLGVKRGALQGTCAFSRLSINFILEALVKTVGAVLLIEFGKGVTGAVSAISASVIVAYFLPPLTRELDVRPEEGIPPSFREGMQAIVFFVGQVIINNIDILLVKHFFASEQAGLYAAVALVGRVVYMLCWSVISAMFPISASAKKPEEANPSVLIVPLLLVLGIALAFTAGLGFFPDFILRTIFGAGFDRAGGIDALLMLYAAATGTYSLSVVLMAYEMSRRLANTGWIQLVYSGGIVLGIYFFHSTLRQVILVQLVAMVILLIHAALPFFRLRHLAHQPNLPAGAVAGGAAMAAAMRTRLVKRLRRATEAEVISEFLKNEFYHPEFHPDRLRFEPLVMEADTTSEAQNALRRALLFRRRGTMWRELPEDTEWWEVAITPECLKRTRVFPRAQWRKLATRSFLLPAVAERVRSLPRVYKNARFLDKIQSLSRHLRHNPDNSSIMLIGIDDTQALTIIEGNHRLTAAMLLSPALATECFRYYCGFSPRMTECCWYQTSLANLWRYARNRLKILMYDSEADIARLLPHHDSQPNPDRYADAVATNAMAKQPIAESK
jgi:O-antigen/teichoic acid export membrane protein